jgi:hypothetical protein
MSIPIIHSNLRTYLLLKIVPRYIYVSNSNNVVNTYTRTDLIRIISDTGRWRLVKWKKVNAIAG